MKGIVHCPNCGGTAQWSRRNPWRPFCSRRCRLIDLGEWFAGERYIPGDVCDENQDFDDEGSTPVDRARRSQRT